jgi:hypothetical protein
VEERPWVHGFDATNSESPGSALPVADAEFASALHPDDRVWQKVSSIAEKRHAEGQRVAWSI